MNPDSKIYKIQESILNISHNHILLHMKWTYDERMINELIKNNYFSLENKWNKKPYQVSVLVDH